MLNNIKCIKIIHPLSEVRLYRMVSGFFRLAGIFVCENIQGKEYGDDSDWCYVIEPGSEELDDNKIKDSFNNSVRKFISDVPNASLTSLEQISQVYLNNDLMRGSYSIAYFADSGECSIYKQMLGARKRFESALEELKGLKQEKGDVYLWSAMANCKRRANEIYTIIKTAIQSGRINQEDDINYFRDELYKYPFHSIEELNIDIQKILAEDKELYSAYAIRGFAMELDDDYKISSVNEMKKAVNIIGDKSYASYLYYRIGKYCEIIRPNLTKKMDFYKKAWELDQHNYRAIYKMAINEENADRAIEYWGKLFEILEPRRDLPSLQPIECAYLYKSYHNLGNLYVKTGKLDLGIEYLDRAIEVYKNNKNEMKNGFYQWMFKENWESYKKAAKKKLQVDNVFIDIIKATAQGNLKTKYKIYSQERQRIQMEESQQGAE